MLTGVVGHVIDVEAHLAASLPAFTLVGLPDASLNESRDRVRAAVTSSGLAWPQRRITVNLSPASLPKSGSVTDLAIAVAVLAGAGLVDGRQAAGSVHLGELGLDGQLRAVRGILPSVAAAVSTGSTRVVVPEGNANEARLVPGAQVTAVSSLAELAALYGNEDARADPRASVARIVSVPRRLEPVADLADVRGQPEARWALEVAAAGAHHVLMVGPPGAGKTMLASRLTGILPDLSPSDALAATSIHSIAGTLSPEEGLLVRPPFEAPHHSASAAAIVGGGARIARPGAISRAHAGVLFLDEAPEFPSSVLQTLRQPLESGEIVIHRAYGAARYPARFQLVLAANPCPCGHFYGRGDRCTCSALARRRYFSRLSGPLLDRVDIQVEVMPVARGASESGESTSAVAERVRAARERAGIRFEGLPWSVTAQAPPSWLREFTPRACVAVVHAALDRGRISARGADRSLRIAWTLSDLDRRKAPSSDDVARAMVLRSREQSP